MTTTTPAKSTVNYDHYIAALRAEVKRRGSTDAALTDSLARELLIQYDTVDAAADYLAPRTSHK